MSPTIDRAIVELSLATAEGVAAVRFVDRWLLRTTGMRCPARVSLNGGLIPGMSWRPTRSLCRPDIRDFRSLPELRVRIIFAATPLFSVSRSSRACSSYCLTRNICSHLCRLDL